MIECVYKQRIVPEKCAAKVESKRLTPEFFFAPDSTIWRINRERVLLLGGARALLMQIAHPMVAEAVYHHSYVFKKPLLRLHRTLRLTLALVYGTIPEVQAAVAEIDRAHRPAVGRLEQAVGSHAAGAAYNPRNPRQGLWVQATLIEGAMFGYETLIAPLSAADKQAFYDDSKRVGELLGIKRHMLPATYTGLLDYMQQAIHSGEVAVSDKARAIAPFLTGQSLPLIQYAAYPAFRLTVGLLPPTIRAQFGYTFSASEQRLLTGFCRAVQKTLPLVPAPLRYMTAYQRAITRVDPNC